MSLHAYTRFNTSCQNRSAPEKLSAVRRQLTACVLQKGDKYRRKKVSLSFKQKAESLKPMAQSFKAHSCLLTADR
jgi:hypothetical protein